jgi:hypothetical protein
MYKIFYSILTIVWILDILDLPFMLFLDTKYPINGLAWLLIWILLPSTEKTIKHKNE